MDDNLIDYGNKRLLRRARLRLKNARLNSKLDPAELGNVIGVPSSTYYDLEECDGDLGVTISLSELKNICSTLAITPASLFEDHNHGQSLTVENLVLRI